MKKLNENLIKLVELLNDQQFHDGDSIGTQLAMTRAGIWKAIKKLTAYGAPIVSVKGKGYRLTEPLMLLDPTKIKKDLTVNNVELQVIENIDSTNDYLKLATKPNNRLIACIAETQTQGKGRLGRTWHSPFGQNIYLSLAYPLKKDVSELSGLSLIAGLAVCKALENICKDLYIKWPNDIVLNNKKLGGILIEIQAEAHGWCHVILGIGLNVNQLTANAAPISQPWIALRQVDQKYHDRNKLTANIINEVHYYLQRFATGSLADFMAEWQQKDFLFNKPINLTMHQKNYSGIGSGITEQGHLILSLADNTRKIFASGDATITKAKS